MKNEKLPQLPPKEMRRLIRAEYWDKPTAGLCAGYAQMNLLIIPGKYAADFKKFCQLNSKPCPLLEVLPPGEPISRILAPGADIRTDLPRYRIYRDGKIQEEVLNIKTIWQKDLAAFLLGCSFTFESALLKANIPLRHLQLSRNVPMYVTNWECQPSGPFAGKMVVSMRPMTLKQAQKAFKITAQYPAVHGSPLCRVEDDVQSLITNPADLGIVDLSKPDFGDSLPLKDDEATIFWACGVTSQSAAIYAGLDFFICHAPGHMFISDRTNEDLKLTSRII